MCCALRMPKRGGLREIMNFNTVLIWIVAINCGALIFQGLRSRGLYRDWLVVTTLVLALLGAALLVVPHHAGYIIGGIWALFILVPNLCAGVAAGWAQRQRYQAAAHLAAVLRFLHPSREWWNLPAVYQALEYGRQGRFAEAEELLARLQTLDVPLARLASMHHFRMQGQWEAGVAWIRDEIGEEQLAYHPSLLLFYLRALGEVGALDTLLETFLRARKQLADAGATAMRQAYLLLFAFCGQPAEVAQILAGAGGAYLPCWREFWLATAEQCAGYRVATERWITLRDMDDALLALAVDRRLSHLPAKAMAVLSDEQSETLTRLAQEYALDERYRLTAKATALTPVSYTLIAINFVVFFVEMSLWKGRGEYTLYLMGAMQFDALRDGQWWRAVTAMFLHGNWMHISMNMLALLIFGKLVEPRLGAGRFLLLYFTAGIGSMLFAALNTPAPQEMIVGASGALMGLVGAYGALALWGWLHDRAPVARRQLLTVVVIVALQTVFDHFTPQISGAGHLSGVAIGFLVTAMMLVRDQSQKNSISRQSV